MAGNSVLILQHNVLNWQTQKIKLCSIYQTINPDIILINSHGLKKDDQLKLFNYIVYKRNNSEELNDGVIIGIKRNIKHHLIDDFVEEFLAIRITTTLGTAVIATTYLHHKETTYP